MALSSRRMTQVSSEADRVVDGEGFRSYLDPRKSDTDGDGMPMDMKHTCV